MNRYSVFITTGNRIKEIWKFMVITEDTRESIITEILEAQKEFKYESPVDLMDYVCDTFGWKWEDFSPDIEIEM